MNNRSFVYDVPDDSQTPMDTQGDRITIGVFFDGTCNNRFNTAARKAYEKESVSQPKDRWTQEAQAFAKNKSDESFNNEETNVVKLYYTYIREMYCREKIYIEGIGTTNLDSDDLFQGTAMGHGNNGVVGKMRKGCQEVVKRCDTRVRHITFDVFGFSRGAAAARSFLYEVIRPDGVNTSKSVAELEEWNNLHELTYSGKCPPRGLLGYYMTKAGINPKDVMISIRFVGLFDTVASYAHDFSVVHYVKKLPKDRGVKPDFEKGAKLLNLNKALRYASKVVHLTAQNEYRKQFGLIPLPATNDKMIEIPLPGSHSDIGGGYVDRQVENKELLISEESDGELIDFSKWITEQGWFLTKQLKHRKNRLYADRSVRSEYSKFSLWLMHNFFTDIPIFNQKIMVKSTLTNLEPYPLQPEITKHVEASLYRVVEKYGNKQYNTNTGLSPFRSDQFDKILYKNNFEADLQNCTDIQAMIYNHFKLSDNEILTYVFSRLKSELQHNTQTFCYQNILNLVQSSIGDPINPVRLGEIVPALIPKLVDQLFLKCFRNRFLHWSAHSQGAIFAQNPLVKPHILNIKYPIDPSKTFIKRDVYSG